MELALQNVLNEFKKIKRKLHSNRDRPNVSGVQKIVQWGQDKERGIQRKLGNYCESITFGTNAVKFIKGDDKFQPSRWNKIYPDLYQSLLELSLYVIPEDFEMIGLPNICVNKNLKCLPHNDCNKGDSIIIAIGDYTGGRLILHHSEDNLEYIDIQHKPFKFNGRKIKHSTEDFIGDRWSIIYYT